MECARRRSVLLPAVMAFSHENHKMSFLSHAAADLSFILSAVLELNGCRQPSDSLIELKNTGQVQKDDIANIAFQRKGVWLMCQKAEMSSEDSRVERLSSIRKEIAHRVFGTSSLMSNEAIEKLMAEQRDLERALAAVNRIDSQFASVNASEVRQCMPTSACLLEFIHVSQVVPDMRQGLKQVLPRYVAAVVLSNSAWQGDEPLLFDFGALDDDIEQYMRFFNWSPRQLEKLPKSLAEKMVTDFFAAGHRLRERLLDPILHKFPDLDHLIVAADGPLTRLPWQALPSKENGYVLDLDMTISYVSSAREILTWSTEAVVSQCGCVVVADPAFELKAGSSSSVESKAGYVYQNVSPCLGDVPLEPEGRIVDQILKEIAHGPVCPEQPESLGEAIRSATAQDRGLCFGPLKHTRVEGEMVVECLDQAAESFNFSPTKSFFGEDASSTVLFTLGPLRILHIATHGFYVNPSVEKAGAESCRFLRAFTALPFRDPWHWSGLAFAGAQTWLRQGGSPGAILTAAEVRGLKLPGCELVTLSACHTGLGEMFPGEGVVGLTRAFQLAGAKRVLASQWAIKDDATKDLMNEFYAELIKTHEVGKALLVAQRKLRHRDGRAGWPVFWAGLKLVGNPSGNVLRAGGD